MDSGILEYRSLSPIADALAAQIAREITGQPTPRSCSRPIADRPRYLYGEIYSDQSGVLPYFEVLAVLCQLGRLARDHCVEFELRLGALRGRVSIGGLDQGARDILACASATAISAGPFPLTRTRRIVNSRKRKGLVRVA